jgi:chemotaxis protein MotB
LSVEKARTYLPQEDDKMERTTTIAKTLLTVLTVSALLLFVVSGCVSSKKYADLENRSAATERELQQKIASAEEENAELAQQKEQQKRVMSAIIIKLRSEIAEKTAKIEMLEKKLVLTIVEELFFASGSAEVNHQGRDILERIAPTLKNAENQEIRIVGHADSVPIGKKLSATYPSNWELSTARATAIIQILQWGYDIEPQRLVAEGVAHYRPLVMETEENRASNRVVQIVLKAMN